MGCLCVAEFGVKGVVVFAMQDPAVTVHTDDGDQVGWGLEGI